MTTWYQEDIDTTLDKLQTSAETGLSSAEAARRLERYGPNELVEKGAKSWAAILFDQFKDLMVIILIVAAIVSGFLGEWEEVIIILAIVVLNAIIGFSQEYRAEQAIAALKKLAVPEVTVRRDNRLQQISAVELVPGDILKLETGAVVPADGRLVDSANMRVQEAALTGESEPVAKDAHEVIVPSGTGEVPVGDRRNMVFMGTAVTYGRGTAVVTETGMDTELGNIADLLQSVGMEQTPLQRRLDNLGRVLAVAALVIVALVVGLGLLRGEELADLFLVGVSLAVAAVPEGLPAVVAITLALGSQRMLKRNALIRRLPAVETLGSVTVICSDKTGTLTENQMTVTLLDVAGHTETIEMLLEDDDDILAAEMQPQLPPEERSLSLLVKAGALCNDAVLQTEPNGDFKIIGDPTEGALVMAAQKLGMTKEDLESQLPRVGEVPFTSERKRMTTVHEVKSSSGQSAWAGAPYVVFCKGAVDGLLDICTTVWVNDEMVPLDDEYRQRISDANAKSAMSGQRVLGVAFKTIDELPKVSSGPEEEAALESDLCFVGLISMIDPPRPEARAAVARAREAGIRPIMITGDHPLTAEHIARELTIADDDDKPVTGSQLSTMSSDDLHGIVDDVQVYARVSPEHKLTIVEALQDEGEIVAMTGDGVNDAPALKRADIGVAMGITGTDVSKEAADMVLVDDNFATIVAAIEEGRNIYDNIRKFVTYTLSSNMGELLVMFVGPFLGLPLPLIAVQILWINLVTDGLPGLALAVEPGEKGIMKRPPHPPQESVLARGVGPRIIWIGSFLGILSLLVGYLYYQQNPDGPWQTMIFTVLVLGQMGNAMGLRSDKNSTFSIGLFSNRLMILAIGVTFLLQLGLIYTSLGNRFFSTVPLSAQDMLIGIAAFFVVFLAVEVEKWLRRRGYLFY